MVTNKHIMKTTFFCLIFTILFTKHKNDWMHDLHREKRGSLSTLCIPMETVFHEKKHEDEGNLTK